MINWDCEAQTALSNEEVVYKEGGEKSKLYKFKYQIKDTNEFITIEQFNAGHDFMKRLVARLQEG